LNLCARARDRLREIFFKSGAWRGALAKRSEISVMKNQNVSPPRMADGRRAWGEPVERMSFSTDDLPAGLNDRARYEAWREAFLTSYVPIEIDYLRDRPFRQQFHAMRFGGAAVGTLCGTMHRIARTRRSIAAFTNESLSLNCNLGASKQIVRIGERSTELATGMFTLVDNVHTGEIRSLGESHMFKVLLLGRTLRDLIPNPEEFVARPLDASNPAMWHLKRYIEILLGPDGVQDEPSLRAHVGTTLTDLVALALGAERDAAAIAGLRGLRGARLQIVLAEIKRCYDDPEFSPESLARKLNLSTRSLQDLLAQSGQTFTERVLETRLQAAREMLADSKYAGLKVIDIAHACGFSDISYFNRSFRRRFGDTPGAFR
jgi:AraC-like DNA-binding protein